PQGLIGRMEYRSDLFDAATVERMMGQLRVLIEAALDAPESRVFDLPLMTAEERRRVLVEWNDTARDFPRELPVHAFFSMQAGETPSAVAVTSGEQRLTYAEVEARANQLARHLGSLGVRPGGRVGLCVERSPDLIVGMLGILKAGA
ncbi:AMP-binding protein, partial [Myxococcaceae bacterium JPH2]|nr:AMP-binding protein [Myxococcaceae bacterium JPH2]